MKKSIILALFIFFPFLFLNAQWINQTIPGFNTLNSIHFENAQSGWVAGDGTSVYKTINGGMVWIPQSSGIPPCDLYSTDFANTSIGWVVGAYSSTGVVGYVYKTTNGGMLWDMKLNAVSHRFYTCQVWDTATCWVAGTNNGTNAAIIKTTNGGTNWMTQLSDQYSTIRSIYFIDYLTGWAAGNNTMLKTTNSGASWSPFTFAGDVNCIYFTTVNLGWAGCADGRLLKTTNSGNSWTQVIKVGDGYPIRSITFPNSQVGYFTYYLYVFRTLDGGASWIPLETGSFNELYSISSPTVNNVFTSGWDGAVVYSTNGGGNFGTNTITFRRNNVNKPIVMNGITYDTIMANIPRSTNSLALDINVSIDTVINTVDSNLTFILSHNGIDDTLIYRAGGTGNNFIKTILNDSATIPIGNGTPPFTGSFRPSRSLSQFNYSPPNGLWILRIKESQSSERTGVIKSWGITITYNFPISVSKISEIVPTAFELKQNYPNPFNPVTKIKYSIPKSGNIETKNADVMLKIYNILGKEVATLVNENQSPGEYEVIFDGSKLSSGIYFYKVQSGDFSVTKKMILIK